MSQGKSSSSPHRCALLQLCISSNFLAPRVHTYTMEGKESVVPQVKNTAVSGRKLHIALSGLIGAGKTTLATQLAKVLDLPVFFEPVEDNVYLADFYKDPKMFGFRLQVYLLSRRFRQQQAIIWQGKGGVQDRSIYEDSVFAKMLLDAGLMEEREYNTYISLFNNMSNYMKSPDVLLHLDVPPEVCYERIKMRSRDCESGVSLEYLKNLNVAYEVFLRNISKTIFVIRMDWTTFRSAEDVAVLIEREYNNMHLVRQASFS